MPEMWSCRGQLITLGRLDTALPNQGWTKHLNHTLPRSLYAYQHTSTPMPITFNSSNFLLSSQLQMKFSLHVCEEQQGPLIPADPQLSEGCWTHVTKFRMDVLFSQLALWFLGGKSQKFPNSPRICREYLFYNYKLNIWWTNEYDFQWFPSKR